MMLPMYRRVARESPHGAAGGGPQPLRDPATADEEA
jgi:hypothetical protein